MSNRHKRRLEMLEEQHHRRTQDDGEMTVEQWLVYRKTGELPPGRDWGPLLELMETRQRQAAETMAMFEDEGD